MKIGILTYHRSHNYGAILQAIGLRMYLEGIGHEAYFVDYWPQYHRKMYKVFPSLHTQGLSIRGRISGFLQDLCLFPSKYRRIQKFRDFINQYIDPYCLPMTEYFDCVVCGSDQIWRKQTGLKGKYNSIYFGGGNIDVGYYISYAGSMGEINLSNDDEAILKDLFSNFKAISVREENLAKTLIAKNIVKDLTVVADPTILLGSDKWNELLESSKFSIKGRYVLYYKLMYDSFNDKVIKQFADSHDLQLITLEGNIRIEDYFNGSITNADPLEMLSLIANADFVFTSSYHGLVFSLLFHRQVVCAFKHNKDRAISLLSYLDIPERLIDKSSTIPSSSIDYCKVEKRLEELAQASRDWLEINLTSEHN